MEYNISLSDVIVWTLGVLALFVAIQFGFLVFYFKVSERFIERQKSETEKILSTDFKLQKSNEIVARAWVENTSIITLMSCILANLVKDVYGKTNATKAAKMTRELHEAEMSLQKPILELLVLMNDQTQRSSAIHELSQEAGDIFTLNLFNEFLKREPDADPFLKEAHRQLLNRLSAKVRAH